MRRSPGPRVEGAIQALEFGNVQEQNVYPVRRIGDCLVSEAFDENGRLAEPMRRYAPDVEADLLKAFLDIELPEHTERFVRRFGPVGWSHCVWRGDVPLPRAGDERVPLLSQGVTSPVDDITWVLDVAGLMRTLRTEWLAAKNDAFGLKAIREVLRVHLRHVHVIPTVTDGRFGHGTAGECLVDSLWMLFLRSLEQGRYKACERCGRVFLVESERGRPQRFCHPPWYGTSAPNEYRDGSTRRSLCQNADYQKRRRARLRRSGTARA